MKEAAKKKTIRRLKILEGQIRGLQKMVEKDQYCIDILRQSSAVKKALSGVEDMVLENHLATHGTSQMKHGKAKQAIREILLVYKLSKNK
ncbi:MAG: hypothetical protein A2672_02885 [Candidatus Wildermuthbacteria bacterium RIFCSPHIGHO2_01_FULL_49_22b]|uniref:Transcriptional regulator n=1 Tax=Candidatus Wildermuthbacteria bacterium RIFCSPHIGHO2_01_FULL_49_22b TaxID=1802448 RepID=A0A1G2QVK2_9BACT|nr:MAG: hypothetical protein A2672_02885 [Candidatus Wildermuthbacteria bacterium RIFCSPHIGHO2_01_FULL_49_22b]